MPYASPPNFANKVAHALNRVCNLWVAVLCKIGEDSEVVEDVALTAEGADKGFEVGCGITSWLMICHALHGLRDRIAAGYIAK
jgi:hypothetical protein